MRKTSKRSPKGAGWKAALSRVLEVHELKLPNGLRVRLLPNREVPVVSLYTFFRVGSRNERPGITGISHLFEHMMFNGAKKYGPKMFDRVLEASGGRSNAYTSTDVTVYYDDFPPEALEQVLDLESDRMRSLAISDRMLRSEREVVKEERRLRVDNEIPGMMDEELSTLLYKAHPYRWPVIGWMRDIEAIRRADCEAYFRTYYAPNNALLYVAGDLDVAATARRVRKFYGNIPKGPPAPQVLDAEPPPRGERRATVHHPAQAPALMVGHLGPNATDPDTLALDVLQYALSVGEGSRLLRELVYRQKVAVSVGMDWSWRVDPGSLTFFLELSPDADPSRAEQALYAELDRAGRQPLTPAELERAKNNLRAHLLRELSTNSGRAHALGTYELLLGSWRTAAELPDRYQAITAEQVQAAAARYLRPERRAVVTLIPAAEPAGAAAEVA